MVDFVLKLKIVFMLGGLRPQAPAVFGLNPPSQVVIRYHWLAFLNQVRKNRQFPSSLLTTVDYKIDHISKTNKNYNRTHELENPFQNIAHLLE